MTCDPTKNTGTDARCDKSCSGGCSTAGSGCRTGSPASSDSAASPQPIAFAPMPLASGRPGTVASRTTGAERCTDCMQGQGDDCHCREPINLRGMRWCAVALVAFWVLAAIGLRSCA